MLSYTYIACRVKMW